MTIQTGSIPVTGNHHPFFFGTPLQKYTILFTHIYLFCLHFYLLLYQHFYLKRSIIVHDSMYLLSQATPFSFSGGTSATWRTTWTLCQTQRLSPVCVMCSLSCVQCFVPCVTMTLPHVPCCLHLCYFPVCTFLRS